MAVHTELFSTGAASPDALWAVIGDPWRLPEWTDVDEVLSVAPEPLAPGTVIAVLVDAAEQRWEVSTVESRLIEARAETPRGGLALGVRVAPDPLGCRIVIAASLETNGIGGWLRARLADIPGLRRRFDHWVDDALRLAR